MPFVQRIIEPKYLSRTALWDEDGKPLVSDEELEAVTNNTLCNALRQLASLVLIANDIFTELDKQLITITERSGRLKVKIGRVEETVAAYDPKKVTVPESDISTFSRFRDHYVRTHQLDTDLFQASSRPNAVQQLYETAAKTPVHVMRQLDRWRRDGHRSSRFFLCTPILGSKRRRMRNRNIDIETRMPAAVEELRRWTSTEALGDVTVAPDCSNRIVPNVTTLMSDGGDLTDGTIVSDDEAIDHKLPSPEEQVQVVALKFPAEVITVDISGRSFDRMSGQRRSLLHGELATEDGSTVRRRGRTRKPRNRRRNTLAGTDQKEIRDALTAGEDPSLSSAPTDEPESPETSTVVGRSKSSDLLRSTVKKDSPDYKKSHFNSIKQWGMNRLKMINNKMTDTKSMTDKSSDIDDINIYETVTVRRKRTSIEKDRKSLHERKPSCSSSDKSSINIPINTPLSAAMNIAVRLRESSVQRRLRRSGGNKDEPHSSSGNWSASSESGRASIGSEITSTTNPKSTTSAATSNNSLNQHAPSSVNSRRRYNANTSASGSVTSEGTLTPDIIHDLHEDGETSSVYSCDTEGYYTSFHMDSGLKTLKEEDSPVTPLHSTTAFSNSNSSNNTVLSAENEYELFGKGSTSTTTSSAGTVCTTLRAADSNRSLVIGPAVPERKSSLSKLPHGDNSPESSLERDLGSDKTGTVKRSPATKATVIAMVHKDTTDGDVSPDSGHNTSSSPIESINSPNGARSCSEFEYSESSDMEGADRIERIRVKTTMSSARIPSMCVITPPQSDDESVKSHHNDNDVKDLDDYKTHMGSQIASKTQLSLPLKPLETDLDILQFSENNNESPRVVITPISGTTKMQLINVNPQSGYATVEIIDSADNTMPISKKSNTTNMKTTRASSPSGGSVTVKHTTPTKSPQLQPIIKATLLPLNNMLGRLRTNFNNFSVRRESKSPVKNTSGTDDIDNSTAVGDYGEYVTIADVKNNNEKAPVNIYANTNDVVNRNLSSVLSGKIRETEYVSLNELPCNETSDSNKPTTSGDSLERRRRQGARVTLNSEGNVVYSSDSLKRRKGAHTTFEPGPFVKTTPDANSQSPLSSHRTPKVIRPVMNSSNYHQQQLDQSRPLSPQLGKVVIRAAAAGVGGVSSPTTELVRMPPATIVTPSVTSRPVNHPRGGAYVHVMQEPSSAVIEEEPAHLKSSNATMYDNMSTMHQGQRNIYGYQNPVVDANLHSYEKSFTHQRGSSMYSTLPTRKHHYITADQERSVTPDIMRGLSNKQHYEAELDGFVPYPPTQSTQPPSYFNNQTIHQRIGIPVQVPQVSLQNLHQYNNRNLQQFKSSVPTSSSQFQPINTYRQDFNKSANESMKISPIDPRNTGTFHSSTPARIDSRVASNLESKLMSPKKSTMSTDELYAVIHKSKKKLNINADDLDRGSPVLAISTLSPVRSESSLHKVTPVKVPESGYLDKSKSRLSWSPSKGDYIDFNTNIDLAPPTVDGRSRQSWACSDRKSTAQTSRLDFKKLLLQHGKTVVPAKKLSAVEQLKLSRQQLQSGENQGGNMSILDLSGSPRVLGNRKLVNTPAAPTSPRNSADKGRVKPKIMSPKTNWRFNNPRSDVLSSTILEDCREDDSPNSSNEKSNQQTPSNIQHCISRNTKPSESNKSNVQIQNTAKQLFPKDNATKSNLSPTSMTATQRLQAQRAKFFNSTPVSTSTSSNPNTFPTKNETGKCSPPTLETAF